MAYYRCDAVDRNGHAVSRYIDADSVDEARAWLLDRRYAVRSIRPAMSWLHARPTWFAFAAWTATAAVVACWMVPAALFMLAMPTAALVATLVRFQRTLRVQDAYDAKKAAFDAQLGRERRREEERAQREIDLNAKVQRALQKVEQKRRVCRDTELEIAGLEDTIGPDPSSADERLRVFDRLDRLQRDLNSRRRELIDLEVELQQARLAAYEQFGQRSVAADVEKQTAASGMAQPIRDRVKHLVSCPICTRSVSNSARTCPHCGHIMTHYR